MTKIIFNKEAYKCLPDETVLDACLRNGVNIPFSCRNGVCQSCLQKCVSGEVSAVSQTGLKSNLVRKNYFLACKCVPTCEMVIEPPRKAELLTRAVVYKKEFLTEDICRLLLEPATQVYYHAGQFINLHSPDELVRSYSLSSVPHEDYYLELHIKRVANGKMTKWIFDELKEDDEIDFHGPGGSSHYVSGKSKQSILLLSTGTGLSPVIGIARDALLSGHSGEIYLYYGNQDASGMYLEDLIQQMDKQYPNFHCIACISEGDVPDRAVTGYVTDIAFARHGNLKGWQVYMSGSPNMVEEGEELALKQGAASYEVHSDSFYSADQKDSSTNTDLVIAKNHQDTVYPPPDPELWAALGEGVLMKVILTDFYTRVYEDALLSPYFTGVTKDRLIEKAYSFSNQILTGNKIYFGDRPKNAHHWMVISDELFDYREELMATVLRDHGLSEEMIGRWRMIDEIFRDDIVKEQPYPKMLDGTPLPLDGYEKMTIDVSTLCDGCTGEINEGETVRYHVRLGLTYCPDCIENNVTA